MPIRALLSWNSSTTTRLDERLLVARWVSDRGDGRNSGDREVPRIQPDCPGRSRWQTGKGGIRWKERIRTRDTGFHACQVRNHGMCGRSDENGVAGGYSPSARRRHCFGSPWPFDWEFRGRDRQQTGTSPLLSCPCLPGPGGCQEVTHRGRRCARCATAELLPCNSG